MSVAVSLEALQQQVDEFGGSPFLVTVNAHGQAHVVSVTAEFDGERFALTAGRTSRANMDTQPTVTLLWSARTGGPYSLIVDGRGKVDADGSAIVHPTRAVLHRLAGAAADLPTCVPLEHPD